MSLREAMRQSNPLNYKWLEIALPDKSDSQRYFTMIVHLIHRFCIDYMLPQLWHNSGNTRTLFASEIIA